MSVLSDEHLRFLQTMKVARLATCGDEKPFPKPHCVPVCYAYAEGLIWIAIDEKPKSGRPLRRLRNIETNPHVALTVDHYEDDWSRLAYLIVEGQAVQQPLSQKAREALLERYAQYRSMRLESAVVIKPQRAIFWRFSPEPTCSSEGS